ncbi:hypothetical protein BJX61DRAFT_528556 [Aspergillus egyptiacus]|nr:hypothetical protein BJX61DRAFT_528556 [Aspergillus egyptiacus]
MLRIRPLFPKPRSLRLNSASRHNSQSFNLRHARVKRPWFKNSLTSCLFFGGAIYAWWEFVLSPRLDYEIHHADIEPARPRQPEAGNNAFFIPIGWPHLREGEPYTPSDPESQAFAKLSGDRSKMKALRDDLASMVQRAAHRTGPLARLLGSSITVETHWLLATFPPRAPPAYYRSGVEISETGISWVSKPMLKGTTDTFQSCTRPFHVVLAIKDAYLVLWKGLLKKLNGSSSTSERAQSLSESPKTSFSSDPRSLGNIGEIPGYETQLLRSTSPQSGASQSEGASRHHSSFILAILERLPIPKAGPGSDLHAASLAFRRRLKICRIRELLASRRGIIYFRGPVALKGSLGFCRIEVEAAYDTITSQWISASYALKDGGQFKQKPLGGT